MVMPNSAVAPKQVRLLFVYEGTTLTVETFGAVEVFKPTKLGISPVPLAAKPVDVLVLVQLYMVLGIFPVGFTAEVALPKQSP